MSSYTGPGIYMISPMHATDKCINVWGGGSVSGTQVKLYAYKATMENSQWEIVAAGGTKGDPEVGDREYHILGVESGLMLCAAKDGSMTVTTISTRTVTDGSARWKIRPAGNGTYYFISVSTPSTSLAVSGAATTDGAELITYTHADASHFQFKLIRP